MIRIRIQYVTIVHGIVGNFVEFGDSDTVLMLNVTGVQFGVHSLYVVQ